MATAEAAFKTPEAVRTRSVELQYRRFSRLNRILHVLMIISFMSLALTGMTLKFSYTAWAATLSHLLGGYESAGYIHRVAAVLMVGIFVTHLVDLTRRKSRDYGSWRAMLFGPDTMLPDQEGPAGLLGHHQVVPRHRGSASVRALDVLGEVRLLRRLLGHCGDRLHGLHALVPRARDPLSCRAG